MSLTPIGSPFKVFHDSDGTPLENGYLYIGEINKNPETTPISVYWDEDRTPAAQPIRTIGGHASRNGTPSEIFTSVNYSITIRDKNRELVSTTPKSQEDFTNFVSIGDFGNDLAAAISAIGSTKTTLLINMVTTIADGVTVITPDTLTTWFTDSGLVQGTAGGGTETFVINGPLTVDAHQIFGDDLTVDLGGKISHIYPDNWAENTTPGTTVMTDAIEKAVIATRDTGIEIHLAPETYILGDLELAGTGGSTPGNSGPTFVGHGDNSTWSNLNTNGGTIFKAASGASYIIKLGDGTNSLYRSSFKNMGFDGNSSASDGIWLRQSPLPHMENVVFEHCKGALIPQRCDRLTMTKCAFYDNVYAYYYDEAVHGTDNAAAAISLTDIHHRSNDYNLYLDAERTTHQWRVVGGYWSSANINDVLITGAMQSIVFDGVNFENTTNGSTATKDAYFKIGMVHAGIHIGIDLISFVASKFSDNNILAERPALMAVVDSTDNSEPSLRQLNISRCSFKNMRSDPLVVKASALTTEIDDVSEITKAQWVNNNALAITPPVASTIWINSALSASQGLGIVTQQGGRFYSPQVQVPVVNRTAAADVRLNELGGFHTNEGATITNTMSLPPVEVGYQWEFICMQIGRKHRIDPQADEGFVAGNGLGKYVELSTTVGDRVIITGVSTTKAIAWVATVLQGALTYEV